MIARTTLSLHRALLPESQGLCHLTGTRRLVNRNLPRRPEVIDVRIRLVSTEGIPQNIKDFISAYIQSVEQLEILLKLFEVSPRAMTADEVEAELHISHDSAERRLKEFHAREILELDGDTYRFRPASRVDAAAVQTLEQLYKERRVAVITQIFANPMDNIQTFADAFKFKPK